MIRTGEVIEAGGGILTLLFERPEACERCGQCSGGQHNTTLEVPGEAQVGDRVDIEIESGRVAQGAMLAYVLPLAFLLLGLLLASPLHRALGLSIPSEGFAILCTLAGLLVGLGLMWLVGRRPGTQAHFTPRVVAVHPKAE